MTKGDFLKSKYLEIKQHTPNDELFKEELTVESGKNIFLENI